jgi:drug/metabolite transporter (DMT)-like permease
MNKGIYFAAFTALLWGFLAIALKVSLNDLPPVTVTWFRFIIAFISLFIYYLFSDRKRIKIITRPPLFAIISGVCLGLNYIGFITGIHYTSPGIGQIFIQTGPVMLAITGFIFFKEKLTLRRGIGLFILIAGMTIFYHEKIIILAGGLEKYRTGVLWILFGALSWLFYAIFQKKAVIKFNPMQLNLVLFLIPSIYLLPWVKFDMLPALSPGDWILLLFLGLNTLGAYGSLSYALKYLEANKVSVIIILNPLITFAVMAILKLKKVSWIEPEEFSFLTIAGALFVLSGAILTVFQRKKAINQEK